MWCVAGGQDKNWMQGPVVWGADRRKYEYDDEY